MQDRKERDFTEAIVCGNDLVVRTFTNEIFVVLQVGSDNPQTKAYPRLAGEDPLIVFQNKIGC